MENNILYSPRFTKRLEKIPQEIIELAIKKEIIFRKSPLHPSLRIHPLKGGLKGYWSLSINKQYRIIFEYKKTGEILFISIGKHDIYRNL